MHPAPSVIVFSVFSGLGFGILFLMGFRDATGMSAFWRFFFGYGFAVSGLLASTYHLANRKNAIKSFREWRTSWLSREAWLAVLALLVMAIHAIGAIFFATPVRFIGAIAGVLSIATVFSTGMIYAQLPTVTRWNHWLTPALFIGFSLAGATYALGHAGAAFFFIVGAVAQLAHWLVGDNREGVGSTRNTATGLKGDVRPIFPAHSRPNYLMREMVYEIGRKHALKLRVISFITAWIIPFILLAIWKAACFAVILGMISHLIGAFASRWLFFAEAKHSVGLYY